MIDEAERLLSAAARHERPGRFQLEAALQSAHIEGARAGRIDWRAIAVLYEGLVRTAPTVGALVGRAAAIAEADGPAGGLTALERVSAETAGAITSRIGPYARTSSDGSAGRPRRSTPSIERSR